MLRNIAGLIAGYLTFNFLAKIPVMIASFMSGTDPMFRQGTHEFSVPWLVFSLLVSLVAGFVAGSVSGGISRGRVAPMVLAAVMLVFGVYVALAPPLLPPAGGDVANAVAADAPLPPWPAWFVWLNPLAASGGILLGAELRSRLKAAAAAQSA